MEKQELLNNIIQITRETGQGLTGIVGKMKPDVQVLLDSLEKDGYITKHEIHYNHLPDDCFYMPKGCYNLWKDDDQRALFFVRLYLKQTDDLGANMTINDVITNIDFMSSYANWLQKNEKELLKLVNLKQIKLDKAHFHPFTTEELELLHKKKWYKKDDKIADVLKRVNEEYTLNLDMHRILEELLSLYKTNMKNYKDKFEEDSKKFEDVKLEISMLSKLRIFLSDKKGTIKKAI